MDNKKYIDKVIEHLVRSTKIDYENDKIHYPFFLFHLGSSGSISFFFSSHFSHPLFFSLSTFFSSFTEYCKNTFGLTDQEIGYVWNQYRKILINKIEN